MRIGIDARTVRDDFPGIGRYVYNLLVAMQLETLEDRLVIIYDPTATSTRHNLAVLAVQPNVHMAALPLDPRAPRQQWELPRLLRHLALDVFHAPYYLAACFGLPCPLVLSMFDLTPLTYPPAMPRARDRLAYWGTVALALAIARRVVVSSLATQADLARHFRRPAKRTAVVPLAAAPVFSPASEEAIQRTRQRYHLPPRYILHVGVNKPHKNLETLLQAYHPLCTQAGQGEAVGLVLAGRHFPRYFNVRDWAVRHGLGGSVLALGNVPDEDLQALYSGAACVAVPSLYEGFGLPALEAMACGAPVLASATSSLPEVAGDAALLLDPHNVAAWTEAMGRVLDDPALQADLRQRGLSRARNFSWVTTARATLEVYRSLGA